MLSTRLFGFRIFGTDVEVTFGFLLLALFIFMRELSSPAQAAGIIILFGINLLAHEFGHTGAYWLFGIRSSVSLHMLGGYCVPETTDGLSRGKQMFVSAAGPAAGLLVAALYLGLAAYLPVTEGTVPMLQILHMAAIYGFVLNIFNLMPVYPMDGGKLAEGIFARIFPNSYIRHISILSLVVSGLLLLVFLRMMSLLGIFIMLEFIMLNVTRLREAGGVTGRSSSNNQSWKVVPAAGSNRNLDSAEEAAQDGDFANAAQFAERFLATSEEPETRGRALAILVRSLVGLGKTDKVKDLLATIGFDEGWNHANGADVGLALCDRGEFNQAWPFLTRHLADNWWDGRGLVVAQTVVDLILSGKVIINPTEAEEIMDSIRRISGTKLIASQLRERFPR